MTEQTFDPYASLAMPDMLDQAKLKLVWHPFWKSLKGTPLENDLPVLIVELVHEYLKRHAEGEIEVARPDALLVQNLAALVRRLAYRLKKHTGSSEIAENAMEFLHRYGLQGSILRITEDQPSRESLDSK